MGAVPSTALVIVAMVILLATIGACVWANDRWPTRGLNWQSAAIGVVGIAAGCALWAVATT